MVNDNTACSGTGQSNGMPCFSMPMITPVCTCCINCSKDMGRCMNESYSTAMPGMDNPTSQPKYLTTTTTTTTSSDSSPAVTVVVVSSCVVIAVIAILITACYWIDKKHKGNG
ncbi:uncharacterized protein LOC117099979, partial [Anneissia japonica]|uniref:uncharacterized protein LOC117099979 n=1 Tax=Anneissia japonica TaxID=1529436 RepID=UPI0014257567